MPQYARKSIGGPRPGKVLMSSSGRKRSPSYNECDQELPQHNNPSKKISNKGELMKKIEIGANNIKNNLDDKVRPILNSINKIEKEDSETKIIKESFRPCIFAGKSDPSIANEQPEPIIFHRIDDSDADESPISEKENHDYVKSSTSSSGEESDDEEETADQDEMRTKRKKVHPTARKKSCSDDNVGSIIELDVDYAYSNGKRSLRRSESSQSLVSDDDEDDSLKQVSKASPSIREKQTARKSTTPKKLRSF